MSQNEKEIIYFTDPMCSWCYGFSKEIKKFIHMHKDEWGHCVIPGGLRIDHADPTPDNMVREILHHWHSVSEKTGLEFQFDFFDKNPGFIYNTLFSCKAVVTAGLLDREKGLSYLDILHRLFYREGKNPLMMETFLQAAELCGLETDLFEALYKNQETEDLTRQGFQFSQESGIRGFPSVVLHQGGRLFLISNGYTTAEVLTARTAGVAEDLRNEDQ